MRTIKRYSLQLNKNKWQTILHVSYAYGRQKDRFLTKFRRPSLFARFGSYREARNHFVTQGYRSPFGLQARMWKLALKEAFETINKWWLQLAEELRLLIYHNPNLSEIQRHYAFWVLCSARRMAQLVSSKAPEPSHFLISSDQKHKVVNYLRRTIRRKRGKLPMVRKERSFTMNAEMYRVFEKNGTQYISIMTLEPGERLIIPLTGRTTIEGNLRVVLDEKRRRVEVHRAVPLRARQAQGAPKAVDLGVTEVMTDSDGHRWRKGLGQLLMDYLDRICDKGRKRNRLYALARRAEERGDKAKAKRIRKNNLGQKKRHRHHRQMHQTLECKINHSPNNFFRIKDPSLLIHEWLRHLEGKFNSKRLSRLVSFWVRGFIKDRLSFKASAGGSRRERVNLAYSSPRCPRCWFVHPGNRRGGAFQCLFCGYGGDSDGVAAGNLLGRWDDPEILPWTPRERVKAVLPSRFRRRLERWEFDFPPEAANMAVLEEVGLRLLFRARLQAPAS